MKKILLILFAALVAGSVNAAAAPASLEANHHPGHVNAKLRLTEVQFADPSHGWTLGTLTDNEAATLIWHTKDAGHRWKSVALPDIRDAAFAFADVHHGWAVGRQDCSVTNGETVCGAVSVFHTSDGGESWKKQMSVKTSLTDRTPEVQAINREHVYVREDAQIWHTTDGGMQWTDVSISSKEAHPYRISFVNASTGYASGRVGTACPPMGAVPSSPNADCRTAVWKTKDGGRLWTILNHAPRLSGEWYPVDVQFVDKRHGFLLLVNPNTHGSRLYATTNAGTNWKQRNDKLPGVRPYPVKLDFVNRKAGWVPLSVGAGPVNGGLMKTVNGGAFFAKVDNPNFVSVEDSDLIIPREGWVIALDPKDPQSRLLWHTGNGGIEWHNRTPSE